MTTLTVAINKLRLHRGQQATEAGQIIK
jgi:hypothetical protein